LVFVVARALDRTFPEGQGSWRELLPTLSWSQRVLSFRVIFALAALVATWLLLRLVELNGRSPWWVVLFAWNPLTILETSGMAHVDIVGVALMLGSMLMLARSRAATAGALLAMATMVKPFAIVLLPFMLAGSSRAMRCVIGFLVTVLLVGVPIVQFQGGMSGAYATAETVAARWEANGSYYEWYKSQFGTIDGHFMLKAKADARRNAVAVVCCVAGVMLLAGAPVAAAGYGIFVAMLLVGTTVYPWYLLWPLALAPLARTGGPTLLVWSGTASICYLLWRSNDWTLTPAQRWAEYAPVYAILVLELAWVIKTAARKRLSGLWPGCISDSIKT